VVAAKDPVSLDQGRLKYQTHLRLSLPTMDLRKGMLSCLWP
jgi:hypothetical protein